MLLFISPNRLPCVILDDKTPHEVIHIEKPAYEELKTFGCLAKASNLNVTHDKLDERGIPCIFIGYSGTQKGYKLINLINGQEFVSRDVKWYENIFPYHIFHTASIGKEKIQNGEEDQKWIDDVDEAYIPSENKETEEDVAITEEEDIDRANDTLTEEVRRSSRTHKPPVWHKDYKVATAELSYVDVVRNVANTPVTSRYFCMMVSQSKIPDPIHFKDAMKHKRWLEAMNEELEALEVNHT